MASIHGWCIIRNHLVDGKVPPLAFALGTYLPMEINTPLLIGGLIAYFVQNSTKDKELADPSLLQR